MTVSLNKQMTSAEIDSWGDRDHTDLHFGLIPTDMSWYDRMVSASYHQTTVSDVESIEPVMVFTNADSFVEWGERITYDPNEPRRDPSSARYYNAPGLHVVVRFAPLPPVQAEHYPKPWPAHNPTGLWKSEESVSGDRADRLFRLGIQAVEQTFGHLLADGFRFCDYACISDAEDWSQAPSWQVGSGRLLGMYA